MGINCGFLKAYSTPSPEHLWVSFSKITITSGRVKFETHILYSVKNLDVIKENTIISPKISLFIDLKSLLLFSTKWSSISYIYVLIKACTQTNTWRYKYVKQWFHFISDKAILRLFIFHVLRTRDKTIRHCF